jgi:tetratricopeptide (TPR) repeat protein
MSLGQKIRELRISRGLTQSDLGLGLVTPSMISQIESDKANPSYKVLEAIAAKLGTPLEYFLADIQTQLEQTTTHRVAKGLISLKKYENAAESLAALLENPSDNLNQMEAKFDLGEAYFHLKRYKEAKKLFEEVIEMATEKGNSVMILHALNMLGQLEHALQKFHLAIYNWRKAYEHFAELTHPEPYLQSQILTNLGNIHYKIGEFKEALKYYNEAYQLIAGSNHIEEIGFTYMGLGLSYRKIREYEKASEYSQYAIAIFESLKNVKKSIDVKRNYAVLKGEEGDVEGAMEMLGSCIEDYNYHGYESEASVTYGEIARLFLREKRYEEAVTNCQRALALLPKHDVVCATIFRTLGLAQDATGQTDAAITSLQKAVELYEHHHILGELAETYSLLAERYERSGQFEQANQCLNKMSRALKENLKERGLFL